MSLDYHAFVPVTAQRLTPRELEVCRLLGRGCSAKAIAADLGLSVHTVRRHLEHIYVKLDARCRAVAVIRILQFTETGGLASHPTSAPR